jgi:hypothetical protein
MWGTHVYTLLDAKKGNCRVKQTILKHPRSHNFYIMPSLGMAECVSLSTPLNVADCASGMASGYISPISTSRISVSSGSAELPDSAKSPYSVELSGSAEDEKFCEQAIAEVEGLFDYIICDKIALKICDRAIVVCDPYQLSLRCCDRELAKLADSGVKNIQLLLNKVNGGLVFDGEIMTPQEIATILHTPLLGIVPEDLTLPLGKCRDETRRAFKIVAENLSGKSQKTLSVIKPYLGMGGLIKRKLRNRI